MSNEFLKVNLTVNMSFLQPYVYQYLITSHANMWPGTEIEADFMEKIQFVLNVLNL